MEETPSSVLYTDFRQFGGIAHRDTAQIVLNGSALYGGKPLRQRVDDKTFLSREIVHARPHALPPELFSDFASSAQRLCARLITAHGGGADGSSAVIAHYRGPAAHVMAEALEATDIDAAPYHNMVRKIMSLTIEPESDRALLLVMLFVITGCLASPAAAINAIDAFANVALSISLDTLVAAHGATADVPAPSATPHLGLIRLVDGAFRPPIYRLSASAEGTILGCLPSGPSTIADVDPDVSRNHARIWCDGMRWFIADLGSTNGTRVISGADKSLHDLASSKGARMQGVDVSEPFEISNSDIICLGATTRFLVMKLAS